jgi:6-phosphofructokinase 1
MEMRQLKILGVVTTGGDAPGMNAAIRGVVRIAHTRDFEVLGFEEGWEGLLKNSFRRLTPRSVGGILHLGEPSFILQDAQNSKKMKHLRKLLKLLN